MFRSKGTGLDRTGPLRYWAIDSGSLNCAKAIIEVQWQSAVLKIRNKKGKNWQYFGIFWP